MKTCSNCNISVADEEIYCPQCGEMLLGCGADSGSSRRVGGSSLPAAPAPMTVGDITLGKRYGKRIIRALRIIAVVVSVLFSLAILYCGVMCVLGVKTFNIPVERQTVFGIMALPLGLLAGFLVYFILNILITYYENLSLVGRNTEAQLSLLENQSELISALINTVAESNRRIDVIGEMMDDFLRMQDRQNQTLVQLGDNADRAVDMRDESIGLINENICNAASNTQTLLERVETSVRSGLGRLYKLFYTTIYRGEEPAEQSAKSGGSGKAEAPAPAKPAKNEPKEPEEAVFAMHDMPEDDEVTVEVPTGGDVYYDDDSSSFAASDYPDNDDDDGDDDDDNDSGVSFLLPDDLN